MPPVNVGPSTSVVGLRRLSAHVFGVFLSIFFFTLSLLASLPNVPSPFHKVMLTQPYPQVISSNITSQSPPRSEQDRGLSDVSSHSARRSTTIAPVYVFCLSSHLACISLLNRQPRLETTNVCVLNRWAHIKRSICQSNGPIAIPRALRGHPLRRFM